MWLTAAHALGSGFSSVVPGIGRSVEDGLLRWLRAAELTCDRAALLVVQVCYTNMNALALSCCFIGVCCSSFRLAVPRVPAHLLLIATTAGHGGKECGLRWATCICCCCFHVALRFVLWAVGGVQCTWPRFCRAWSSCEGSLRWCRCDRTTRWSSAPS